LKAGVKGFNIVKIIIELYLNKENKVD